MNRDSFLLHTKFYKPLSILTKEQLGELLIAMFEYHMGEDIHLPSELMMAWEFLKVQFDLDNKKYQETCDKNRENVRKRWNKKNTTVYGRIPSDTKNTDNDNEYDNDNDNENIISTSSIEDIDCPTSEKSNDDKETKVGEEIRKFYNEEWQKCGSDMPKINGVLIGERYKLLTARIRQYGMEAVKQVIILALQSDFLNGRKTEFRANFEWIMRPKNFPKVLDGNYNHDSRHNPDIGRNLQSNDTSKYKNQTGW